MFQSYIGLEIHIHLLTKSKVFCSCPSKFGDEPNTNICPICMGYPGTLPVLNDEAVKMAYLVSRALNCSLSSDIYFDRKNYYYPDLPKNYQISQFNSPIGTDGYLDVEFHKHKKRVRIKECHLEEDAGKMIHAGDISLCDFNRAGTPLLEIVTQPDLEVGEEAETLLQYFRRLVRYLGVCDGNMEEGSLRCDANVSVNLRGEGLGSKVEIKNMNSFKFVRKALNFEIDRQTEILERGGTIVQETRLWNENRDISESMRIKESAHDYRYFPEPDLPPFHADSFFLSEVDSMLVELPADRKARIMSQYILSEFQASFVCEEKETADYFEKVAALVNDPETIVTWMASDVKKMINRFDMNIDECPLTPERFSSLLKLLNGKRIHGKIAKQVLDVIFKEDKEPETIIKEKGWEQITDRSVITNVIEKVIMEHQKIVDTIRAGDSKPLGFLMGQAMKATSGRAEPVLTKQILQEKIARRVLDFISFSGAITGKVGINGMIEPGNLTNIKDVLKDGYVSDDIVIESHQPGKILSEEIIPEDWAELIHIISSRLNTGNTTGFVIGHGTDTLPYSSSLLHWLFGNAVPIVITASFQPFGVGSEAAENLKKAVELSAEGKNDVSVYIDKKVFPAVNLRFERVRNTENRTEYNFKTWNEQSFASLPKPFNRWDNIPKEKGKLISLLETIINSIYIAKVFPGLRGESLIALAKNGIKYFIIELFDTGTANLRKTPYSLRNFFEYAEDNDIVIFCTSQQEGIVDFSDYITSHDLWKEGAIPMGPMITESAYTRLIAALMVSSDESEVKSLMEE